MGITRISVGLGTALLLAGGPACSDDGPSEAFCEAMTEFQTASTTLQADVTPENAEAAREAIAKLAEEAPEEVADEADTLLETMDAALQADDPSLLQADDNVAAAEALDEVAADC